MTPTPAISNRLAIRSRPDDVSPTPAAIITGVPLHRHQPAHHETAPDAHRARTQQHTVNRTTNLPDPPASAVGGTAITTGGNRPHVLQRAGLIKRMRLTALADPAHHVDTRSHRACWPTGLARHSKPNRPAEIGPDVESDAQM